MDLTLSGGIARVQRHEGTQLNAEKPAFDALGQEYARIAFGIDRHAPGFIDAYLGPEEVRASLDREPAPPPDEIAGAARALLRQVAELPTSEARQVYLSKQITAME